MADRTNIGGMLPKLNLGTILKDVGEVVSTLKTVAGTAIDSKDASQFEGKTGSSALLKATWGPLPNPIHVLAGKLLQGTGSILESLGSNLSSFGAGLEADQPRDVPGVDKQVTLPSLSTQPRLDAMAEGLAADSPAWEGLDPLLQKKLKELRAQLEQIEKLISMMRAGQQAKRDLLNNTPRWSA